MAVSASERGKLTLVRRIWAGQELSDVTSVKPIFDFWDRFRDPHLLRVTAPRGNRATRPSASNPDHAVRKGPCIAIVRRNRTRRSYGPVSEVAYLLGARMRCEC